MISQLKNVTVASSLQKCSVLGWDDLAEVKNDHTCLVLLFSHSLQN